MQLWAKTAHLAASKEYDFCDSFDVADNDFVGIVGIEGSDFTAMDMRIDPVDRLCCTPNHCLKAKTKCPQIPYLLPTSA